MSSTPVEHPYILNLALLSRIPARRDELETEFNPLKEEFPTLKINKFDFKQLFMISSTSTQMVVLDLENWLPSDELLFTEIRGKGYRGPVVVLTNRLTESASASYKAEQLVFFDRRNKPLELVGIVKRFLMGSVIASRKHLRHETDEEAEVQIEGGSASFICKVRNLSAGGAYIVLDREMKLNVGDVVSVKIRLSKVGRIHAVRARVAWIKPGAFGVEFLNG